MAIAVFSGFLALGNIAGSSFTELSAPADYARVAANFTLNGSPAFRFTNRATAWGNLNALAVYASQGGSDLILYWPLPRSLNITGGPLVCAAGNFLLNLSTTTGAAGSVVGTATPALGYEPATAIFAGSSFNSTSFV